MPRLISFAKTVEPFLSGAKTVTRRDGWRNLRAGDILMAVDKLPRSGPGWKRLGLIEVVDVRREWLGEITEEDVVREGFPGGTPSSFMQLYLGRPAALEDLEREVTRIEFRRLRCSECGLPALGQGQAAGQWWAAGRWWCEKHGGGE